MESNKNLASFPYLQYPVGEKIQKSLKSFVEDLKSIYADQLISVILYGSAVGKDFVSGRSDINTVVILKKVDLKALKRYLNLQKKISKARNCSTFVFRARAY